MPYAAIIQALEGIIAFAAALTGHPSQADVVKALEDAVARIRDIQTTVQAKTAEIHDRREP